MSQFFKRTAKVATTAALAAAAGSAIAATFIDENVAQDTKAGMALGFSLWLDLIINYFFDTWHRQNSWTSLNFTFGIFAGNSSYCAFIFGFKNSYEYPTVVNAGIVSAITSLGWEIGKSIAQYCLDSRSNQQPQRDPEALQIRLIR